ncbi:Short-chain-enoyl-CoA hydratase [Roseobacter fucihabitans]|uniref:Short-chain-enoyl-CoA hydratase n=1 Tax=Roseobacter fucihabitans TaxID=1537242 RepID=A0ABZ2BWA9_9RHOB|nr:crotonase/enoyl-CoA hydratase family protein [Roseobacter litoralis]MBC6967985.1 putative enoyl-CoA hydratase echA8 [Roseobacter litoralis]
MSHITVNVADHIAHVQLNRPEKRNALDQQMFDDLIAAGAEVAQSGARAAVLSGAGESFCAGIDIASLGAMVGQDMEALILPRTHGGGTTNKWQEAAMIWHRLEIPVIAALQGAVYGAGLQIALAADMRIAAPDTKLAVMEMKWGIIPDMGGMVLLPALVRSDVMRRLIYTATPVDAAQGEAWGLVSEIADDPLAVAFALAHEIAGKSPKAIRAAKALANIAQSGDVDTVLMAEARAQAGLLGQAEQMEVIAAQFAKRAPVFK